MEYMYVFRLVAIGALLAVSYIHGQTQVDQPKQARITSATTPFLTGADLPGVCSIGQTFFKTTAAAGTNIYACTAANTWTVQGGVNCGAGMSCVTISNGSRNIAVDTAVVLSQSTAQSGTHLSCKPNGASGTAYNCSMTPSLTVYTQNQIVNLIPDVDCGVSPTLNIDSLGPIALKRVVSGVLVNLTTKDCLAGVPYRLGARGNPVDSFVIETGNGGGVSGSASLTFTAIANAACATRTFTLNGVTAGSAVAAGWPSTLEAGVIGMMRVSAANTIEVRLCNLSGGSVTPAVQTFKATAY